MRTSPLIAATLLLAACARSGLDAPRPDVSEDTPSLDQGFWPETTEDISSDPGPIFDTTPPIPPCPRDLAPEPVFDLDVSALPGGNRRLAALDASGAWVQASVVSPTRFALWRVRPDATVDGPWEFPISFRLFVDAEALVVPLVRDLPTDPGRADVVLCSPNGPIRASVALESGELIDTELVAAGVCDGLLGVTVTGRIRVLVWRARDEDGSLRLRVSSLQPGGPELPTPALWSELASVAVSTNRALFFVRSIPPDRFRLERYDVDFREATVLDERAAERGARVTVSDDPRRGDILVTWETFGASPLDVDADVFRFDVAGVVQARFRAETGSLQPNDLSRTVPFGDVTVRTVTHGPFPPTLRLYGALVAEEPVETLRWSRPNADLAWPLTDGSEGVWVGYQAEDGPRLARFVGVDRCDLF